MDKNNLTIVRHQFAQCVFNHKVQEKAVERLEKINIKIKWANIIVLAFVIIFLILQIRYPQNFIFAGVSISITVFEILFLFLQKEFSFEKRSQEHKKVALKFLELRDKYKNFIVDIVNGLDDAKIVLQRDMFQQQYQIISDIAPQTEYSDYTNAQKGLFGKINTDEEFTWSDNEIDLFLPNELRFIKN
ncbi:SLATT domain-containing protein [Patescibacteria group bacterium]